MPRKPRGFLGYRNYSFIDKDPVIDLARTAVETSGKTYRAIKENGGPSTSTLSNWFNGRTRRPQFSTVASVLLECGVRDINLTRLSRRNTK